MLVAGAVLIVGPWTARNLVRMKAPIPISTSATEALWVGHHDGADGKIADFTVVGTAYADLSNPDKEVKTSNEALHQALTFMTHHPLAELQLIPKKFAVLFRGDGSAMRWMQLDTPTIRPGLGDALWTLSTAFYRVALVVALLGLPVWFSLRDPAKALLAAVVGAWTLLFVVVFFGDERFHFSIVPIFCLWAGASLTAGWQLVATRSLDGAIAAVTRRDVRRVRNTTGRLCEVEERGAAMTVERHCGGEKAPEAAATPRSRRSIGRGATI